MRFAIHALLSLALVFSLAPAGFTQEEEGESPQKTIREELDELRQEVEDLRAWKLEQEKAPTTKDGRFQLPGSMTMKVTGQLRIREELRNHIFSPMDPNGDESNDLARMRTRLRFDFDVTEQIKATIELQDVRILGEEGSTIADTEGVDIRRAFMSFENPFDIPMTVEAGRLVLYYGKQRVIGHLEWFDQGRTYDGLRIKTGDDGWYADVFGVRTNDLGTSDDDDSDLFGVYAGTKGLADGLDIEGYALHVRDQRRGISEDGTSGKTGFTTLGTRWFGECLGFDYETELMYQTGDVLDNDLTAYGAVAGVYYDFEDCPATPKVGFEVNYASGDRNPADGDTETLQVLFPLNHVFYGRADLAALSNLWDFVTSVKFQPHEKVRVLLEHHHLSLQEEEGPWVNAGGGTIRPGARGVSRHLGEEIDMTVWWDVTENLELQFGWYHFLGGGFTDDTGRERDALFAYVQAFLRF